MTWSILFHQSNAVDPSPSGMRLEILLCPGEQAASENAPLLPMQASICVIRARNKWIHVVTPWCLEQSRAKWPVDKFLVSEETTGTFHGQCSTAATWCHLGCFESAHTPNWEFLFLWWRWEENVRWVHAERRRCEVFVILQDGLVARGPAQDSLLQRWGGRWWRWGVVSQLLRGKNHIHAPKGGRRVHCFVLRL